MSLLIKSVQAWFFFQTLFLQLQEVHLSSLHLILHPTVLLYDIHIFIILKAIQVDSER